MNYVIIDELIQRALLEDLQYGDITSESLVDGDSMGSVELISKEDGVLAGDFIFERVFEKLGGVEVKWLKRDGDRIEKGNLIARLKGDARNLLMGERVALNFIQRMSGVATKTYKMTKAIEGKRAKVVCTRKTTPTFRMIEKYAVKTGGGVNHRFSLNDAVMIKDNHIMACGGIKKAVERAKKAYPYLRSVEVEVESLEQLKEAMETEVDVIMLDNMSNEEMEIAVSIIDGRKIVEASGNMDMKRILEIADIGIDYISVGGLTHSVKSFDLSMKNFKIEKDIKGF